MAKKRINVYVDEDIYKEFKKVCALTGETVTAVIDEAMTQYIDSVKMIIESGDKDKLMAMIESKLSLQIAKVEEEIDTHLKAKKEN